ncbi:hypothetical protein HQ533_06035 [Candidatus Woesearchaeota archaeon]|nr:hypothetical protein [Candidatus Woesearchaeota archaeon]
MNKIHYLAISIIVFFIIIFGLIIYNENKEFQEEQLANEQEIASVKQQQTSLDKEFQKSQEVKEQELLTEELETLTRDQDGDGLTYQQEVELGTSDNQIDSDGDNIPDPEDAHPSGGGKIHTITVYWTHNELVHTTQFGIPEDKYLYLKNQERNSCCDDWSKYSTPNDPIIQTIAKDITDTSISTGETCKICIAIDFVQSMIYEYDIDYIGRKEWPKYAIETIIDEKGDCEDTSFLMASILEALNYDVILLDLPGHMAVAIWCDDCEGAYYDYKGKKYYYLETTGQAGNWEIGRIPDSYEGVSATIIEV